MVVLAIDSGTSKCGLAIVSRDEGVLHREVVPVEELSARSSRLLENLSVDKVVLGDRTNSRKVAQILISSGVVEKGGGLAFVDEDGSTLEGRRRYFQENRPGGLRRLIPVGLQSPPVPYDDYVAVILAERYFRLMETNG